MKWLGAILIISSCGWLGMYLSSTQTREVRSLSDLIKIMEFMICEVRFKMKPLWSVAKEASNESDGELRVVFQDLSDELQKHVKPDVSTCMQTALLSNSKVPRITSNCLQYLGKSLGRFDIEGQLDELNKVLNYSKSLLDRMNNNMECKIRCYKTLPLCAGAILALLLI